MLRAKKDASKLTIDLLTTQFEEDREIIPPGFTILDNLERSVLDLKPPLGKRKLPFIKDILLKASENSNAEYLIYTNVDIGLMPHFYQYVEQKIAEGFDALVINRRRLTATYAKVEELPEIYADLGASHPGFDCFVFKRELVDKFVLDDICIGISFIGVAMAHNIFSFAKNPLFVPDQHLSFHIGTKVLAPRNNELYEHNKSTFFDKVYPKLKPHFDLKKFPYGNLPMGQRALKWLLNPSLFTKNYLELEGLSFFQKCKMRLDEIRWRILQK